MQCSKLRDTEVTKCNIDINSYCNYTTDSRFKRCKEFPQIVKFHALIAQYPKKNVVLAVTVKNNSLLRILKIKSETSENIKCWKWKKKTQHREPIYVKSATTTKAIRYITNKHETFSASTVNIKHQLNDTYAIFFLRIFVFPENNAAHFMKQQASRGENLNISG